MDPLSLASLGVGVGSSILGAAFGFDQADAQRRETAEQVRRFSLLSSRTYSRAQAAGGASGMTADSGSLTKYLADMSSEFTKQIDWMHQAGNSRADATEFSALASGLSGFGQSIFKFGAANNWFQTPTVG
jgi:hypothetical protein